MSSKRTVSAVLTALLLATLSCEGGGPDLLVEPPFQGSVEGVVSADEATLPGVTVRLTGGAVRTLQTSASGTFFFSDLPSGNYQVEIAGYPEDVEFTTTVLPARVQEGSAPPKVNFRGSKKSDAAIGGTVTMEGAGLEGMAISISGPESRSALTDADGAFTFERLKRGVYSATLSGFDPAVHSFPQTQQTVDAKTPNVAEVHFSGTLVPYPPAAPTGLAATASGSTTVVLSWKDVSGDETRFEVERMDEALGAWTQVATLGPDTDTFEDQGLTPNTVYRFRVRACNDTGCSAFSEEAQATTEDMAPETPADLAAAATGSSSVDLSWTDRSSNEDRFEVERKAGADGSWIPIGSPEAGATTFADTDLAPNTTYTYRVRACNEIGCSPYSNNATATTDEVAPEAPSALTASATGPTTVSLAWTDGSHNETRFEIQRKSGSGADWVQVGTPEPDASQFGDTGLSPNTTYTYRILACNEVGCPGYSNEATATTSEVAPVAPTDLVAVATGSTSVGLTWKDESENEAFFRVERKREALGIWKLISTLGPNAVTLGDAGLSPATTYVYRVQACNDVGCSAYSNEATAKTDEVAPDAPSGLEATATGPSTVNLSWTDGSDNETLFRVYRKEGAAGSWGEIGTQDADATVFADSGLNSGTAYSYRVSACNGVGCSAFSNEANATTWANNGPNLSIASLYLTQSTQTLNGAVPLVADRDGYLRVFAVASEANQLQPSVRIRYYLGGSLAHTQVLPAPGSSVPTDVNESSLGSTWNAGVPASLIQPGLSILADVDPGNQFPEDDEGDNSFPFGGSPLAMEVRATPTFSVTFVPVRQSANDLLGNVTTGNAAQFMDVTMRMLPISEANLDVHAEYVTSAPVLESDNGNGAWSTVLSEVNGLRVIEGSSRSYYGVVKTTYNSGVAGMGYLGWPTAIGWDRLPSGSGVAAHEWGHNWNRYHAPGCGAANPDPSFPYPDGKIGVWGLDVGSEAPKSPSTYYDFMSYCNPDWISDYSYEAIMDYRQAQGGHGSPGEPEPSLLIWGRVEGDRIILEPAFEVNTIPVLPSGDGEYRLEAVDLSGALLLSMGFQPISIPDAGEEGGHFAFAIPLRSLDRTRIAGLRVSGGGRPTAAIGSRRGPEPAATPEPEVTPRGGSMVEMTWDASSFPMALVRDPATGEVLSFARNGRIRVSVPSGEVEIVFSDGIRSSERVRRTVR